MSTEEERKTELRKKIEYQVACEERAFRIVERLIETPVTEQRLLDALQFLTPDHYNDIVEERAVSKICGYPICGKTLSNIPKQKYAISTKSNKVYDIEGRKNFCTGKCYKASVYLQKQISTAPVWSRQKQPPFKFEVLPLDGKSGYVGDEVVLSQREELKHDLTKLEKLDKYQDALRKRRLKEDRSELLREGANAGGDKRFYGSGMKFEVKTVDVNENTGDVENTCKDECSKIVDNIADIKCDTANSISNMHDIVSTENDQCVYTLERAFEELKIGTEDVDPELDKIGSECSVLEKTGFKVNNLKKTFRDNGQKVVAVCQEIEENGTDSIKKEDKSSKKADAKKQTGEPKTSGQSIKSGPDPGKTKTDYLMRLLDKRKPLLAKMADIQSLSVPGQDNVEGANNVMNIDNDSKSVYPKQSSVTVSNETIVPKDGEKSFSNEQFDNVVGKDNISKVTTLDSAAISEFDLNEEHKAAGSDSRKAMHSGSLGQGDKSKETPVKGKRTPLVQKEVSSSTQKSDSERKIVPTLQLICKTFQAWITVESLEYLNKKIKSDKKESEDVIFGKTELERQYKALERTIDKQETDFENMLDDPADRPSGPLPHFEVLKKEVEDDTIRVQEFMKGSFTYKVEERETTTTTDRGQEVVLPSVDRYDQLLIRQRIVLERISKVLPDLLKPLHLLFQQVFTELRELVFTFNLTKDNILFKPAEWVLVTLVLLKLISCHNSSVRTGFGSTEAKKYFSIVLRGAGSSLEELENSVLELKRTANT